MKCCQRSVFVRYFLFEQLTVLPCVFCFVTHWTCGYFEYDGLFTIPRRSSLTARYNVNRSGARKSASLFKVSAMWYAWITLLLVSSAADGGAATEAPQPVATTRAPPRTLDRQAAELAWRSWLQSPESGNQNAPPRRITTKSLFITPLVCPKGQRLDRNGCVQVVTVNKDEHERILLDQLNALFTSAPSGDVIYDYGDDEPGPLQLSIPIGIDPLAAPLQSQEPSAQGQESQANYVNIDKKDDNKQNTDASIEAELELLKLQNSQNTHNDTVPNDDTNILNHNVLQNLLTFPDKPKRDSPINSTDINAFNDTDTGQKEVVYGHVNVDPVVLSTDEQKLKTIATGPGKLTDTLETHNNANRVNTALLNNSHIVNYSESRNETDAEIASNSTSQVLQKDQTKLNPETDYSDIGEAIKLISRFADVTTDDKFTKDQKKYASEGDSILGTRTKLQYRRKNPENAMPDLTPERLSADVAYRDKIPARVLPKNEAYFRYPWPEQQRPTLPPNYPFRHVQDYWPGRTQVGGVYNTMHGNPRRHHHSFPHNNLRVRGYPYNQGPGLQDGVPSPEYPDRLAVHHTNPLRPHTNNQDLYSLLGLRHWFSSEGASKR